MTGTGGPAHVTAPVAALADQLPAWVVLVRADNPGPMTLEGTNTWVLTTPEGAAAVVDPGPDDPDHLAAVARPGTVSLILLTHGHPDHRDGAARLAGSTGANVHSIDPAKCHGPDAWPLEPGLVLDWGGFDISVLATPGHTADSVCFLAERDGEGVILTGDTILGRGTAVVAWPDGDLGDYLASLELLTAYQDVAALPGHGPALADCAAAARFYLAHRRARLEQVRSMVAAGVTAPAEVVERVYAEVDRSLWPAAERSVSAQLAYLERESDPGAGGLDRP
ncbi:MAG TPA: MBL fold metallo-hydrolase [Micromonosporaceae bacterium]|nr:MBL fold metallo-hydrolase [Micromonosporaceae bacterium]